MNPAVPKNFQWLYKVKELPKLVAAALTIWGTKEVPGSRSNPTILKWAKTLGLSRDYTNDGIAWCGLTIAWLCHLTEKPIVLGPLWALNWRFWGMEVKREDAVCGDLFVKERFDSAGKLIGGHVGMIIAEDETHWHVFGGNQSDTAMVVRFPKTTECWIRRPIYNVMPKGAIKYLVSSEGVPEGKKVA